METTFIIWITVVGAMAALMVLCGARALMRRAHRPRRNVISLGSEREELFVPGDRLYNTGDDYDDDDL